MYQINEGIKEKHFRLFFELLKEFYLGIVERKEIQKDYGSLYSL